MGSGTGQTSTYSCTSRYCHECLTKTVMSSPRVYLRPPPNPLITTRPSTLSNNSTLAPSPRCSPSTRALSTPLRNCRLMNRSSVGELTHQDSVTDPTNWTYSSSSAFLPSDSTVMDQYSESEGEIKRPGRIQRLQKSRLQSRPTSRETAFIPKRRIPGLYPCEA